MSVSFPWIYSVPTILMILFCMVAIVFVAMRPSEQSRAKRYVITSLVIMMLSQSVFPIVMNLAASRVFDTGNWVIVNGIINVLVTSAMIFAIVLLIAAAFLDRDPVTLSRHWDPGGTPLADQPSDNPYAAPRQ